MAKAEKSGQQQEQGQDPQDPQDPPARDALYLVDGSWFIFRAYHALPPLTNPDGTPVNAVFGFVNMMAKLLTDFEAPRIAVVFDAARKNFRNDIYEAYKANREEPPEDLQPQFPLIRVATEAFDIPVLELEGYEADDLIATYADMAEKAGEEVVVISADKDLMQIVRPGVRLYDPIKAVFLGEQAVLKKFGVSPDKVPDAQALIGDSIDNIPGIPGIGPKTASELLNQYGDLETLLSKTSEIKQQKRRESLEEHAEKARISKRLATLFHDVDVPLKLDDLKIHDPRTPKLAEFLRKHGFRSLLNRLDVPEDDAKAPAMEETVPESMPPVRENRYTLVQDEKDLQAWIDKAYERGRVAIDTENTHLTPSKADLVGIAMAVDIGEACYVPLGHKSGNDDLFDDQNNAQKNSAQIDLKKALKLLKPLLEDESVLKIGHNLKYDFQCLWAHGIRLHPVDDTMLLSYVLNGTTLGNGLDGLSQHYFGHTPTAFKEVAGSGKKQVTFDYVDLHTARDYAAEDAELTLRLHSIFRPRLVPEGMITLYERIERPLVPIIADMEWTGIKVDTEILKSMSKDFASSLEKLESEVFELVGHSFNLGSPKQLGKVLFEELGLKSKTKTSTGDYSTSASVLESLAGEHPALDKILEWRQLSKLKSTYTDALQNEINSRTGRVHTSFSMAVTNTGRLSSSDPNLQNIPIRTEEGRKIRTAFVAEKEHVILSVDYSQLELRLVAAMAKVPALIEAFENGLDIHAATASHVFGGNVKTMSKELRRQAKAVNFGIIYGISAYGLAQQLGCQPAEAREIIETYFRQYPEIPQYMEDMKARAKDKGYVSTYYGRKCFIPEIKNPNKNVRSFGERQAINAPLQGTAADIIKRAMVKVPAALEDNKLNGKMLLQIHDELLFEIPEKELKNTRKLIVDIMESAAPADFPLKLRADANSGRSWAEAH